MPAHKETFKLGVARASFLPLYQMKWLENHKQTPPLNSAPIYYKLLRGLGVTLEATLFVDSPARELSQTIRAILQKGSCLKINAFEKRKSSYFLTFWQSLSDLVLISPIFAFKRFSFFFFFFLTENIRKFRTETYNKTCPLTLWSINLLYKQKYLEKPGRRHFLGVTWC